MVEAGECLVLKGAPDGTIVDFSFIGEVEGEQNHYVVIEVRYDL